ncbi:MAG: permease, partial [Anaerolineae bacterium]|nr:permease [Anaerolineae bacterium]
FVESGIPLGVTLSFLVAAPMVNEVALVMLFGMFGWQVAGLYLLSGLTIAIIAGIIIGRMGMERYVEEFVYQVKSRRSASPDDPLTWTERFEQSIDKTREIVGKVWPYVVLGIAVGAFIHGFVPEDALVGIMGEQAWWSVPMAVAVGVPLYSNAAGVIPVVSALLGKGAALGTALAFMMSVVALSLPEIIILRRVLKPRLIALYVAVVACGIIMIGYLFNAIL